MTELRATLDDVIHTLQSGTGSFERLIACAGPPLSGLVERTCPEASDTTRELVVQDIFCLVHKNLGRQPASEWSGHDWIMLVAVRRINNYLDSINSTAMAQWVDRIEQAIEQWLPIQGAPRYPVHIPHAATGDCQTLCHHLEISPDSNVPAMLDQCLATRFRDIPLPSEAIERIMQEIDRHRPVRHGAAPMEEPAFKSLSDPSLAKATQRARWQYHIRDIFRQRVGEPAEDALFNLWYRQRNRRQRLEAMGLPRRSVEKTMGSRLSVSIVPGQLVQSISFPDKTERRRFANRFIWDGDWDTRLSEPRTGRQFQFIYDIWRHRADLTQSLTLADYQARIDQGRPLSSTHKGILLNSRERILTYLHVYRFYLEDMACFGLDAHQGKDAIGVAVTRHGQLTKINKGLHRIAMAQVLELAEIQVQVRSVHRGWWQQVTEHLPGGRALDQVGQALQQTLPATHPPSEHFSREKWRRKHQR
ncbi:hypothetical protein [Larsenimonas rhizosphaerae]|uniref:hypothetical protein n=1 Tax=Larsenimonas rhizosphaerae TaxID=2944682 RepID=UPI0020349946|nr:hypothetical protein [Larsenimonas rhizosphaerae]MCM2131583.1 hypothetical protein [Larsenimonas rhizosphaerae]